MFGAKKKTEDDPLEQYDTTVVEPLLSEMRRIHADLVASQVLVSELDARVEAATELAELRDQVEAMKREKDRLVAEHDRKVADTEHSVGLLRKEIDLEKAQVALDIDLAKREATLAAREEAANDQVKSLAEKLDFIQTTLSEQKDEIFDLVRQLIDNLPNMNVAIGVGAARQRPDDGD